MRWLWLLLSVIQEQFPQWEPQQIQRRLPLIPWHPRGMIPQMACHQWIQLFCNVMIRFVIETFSGLEWFFYVRVSITTIVNDVCNIHIGFASKPIAPFWFSQLSCLSCFFITEKWLAEKLTLSAFHSHLHLLLLLLGLEFIPICMMKRIEVMCLVTSQTCGNNVLSQRSS